MADSRIVGGRGCFSDAAHVFLIAEIGLFAAFVLLLVAVVNAIMRQGRKLNKRGMG